METTVAVFLPLLVWCCMLFGPNKTDGFWVRARRKPQRYPQVSRGFATLPWRKRRGSRGQIACNTTLGQQRHSIAIGNHLALSAS